MIDDDLGRTQAHVLNAISHCSPKLSHIRMDLFGYGPTYLELLEEDCWKSIDEVLSSRPDFTMLTIYVRYNVKRSEPPEGDDGVKMLKKCLPRLVEKGVVTFCKSCGTYLASTALIVLQCVAQVCLLKPEDVNRRAEVVS